MMANIKFKQINLHKSIEATAELLQQINNCDKYIALLTEPWCGNGDKIKGINSNAGNLYFEKGSSNVAMQRRPRAGILVSKTVNSWFVHKYSDRDVCTVCLVLNNKEIYVSSVYMDGQIKSIPQKLIELTEFVNTNNKSLIIGTDSNAHSTIYGNKITDERGEMIENYILSNKLVILNDGIIPTYVKESTGAETFIDLTIITKDLVEQIKDWRVNPDCSFSDHKYIYFTLNTDKNMDQIMTSVQCLNIDKCDWSKFKKHFNKLSEKLPTKIESSSSMDEANDILVNIIIDSLKASCPTKIKSNRKLLPWWSSELTEKRKLIRKEHKKAKKSGNLETYRRLRNEYKRLIKKEKEKAWKAFCEEASTIKDVSKIIKILRNGKREQIGLIRNENNEFTMTPEETMDILMKTHFPNCEDIRDVNKEEITFEYGDKDVSIFINHNTVYNVMKSFGANKAPGPDELKPVILQNLPQRGYEFLAKMYRLSLANGYTSKGWRKMSVIFIQKPDKERYDTAKSFRPITLSSFLLKGLEKIIKEHIENTALRKPLYSQHGFTKGRSCDTILSETVDFIEKAIYRGEYCVGVFLDIQGAFDNLKYNTIMREMRNQGIEHKIVDWYEQILENRTIEASIKGITCNKRPKQGTPQGGGLSTIVWNISCQPLLEKYKKGVVIAKGFADDIILLAAGKDINIILQFMQKAINKALAWGEEEGLTFNAKKTAVIIFTRNPHFKYDKVKPLTMGTTELEYVKETRYLGITIDQRLSWNSHISNKINACKRSLFAINNGIGQTYGLTPDKIFWAWQSVVRPRLTYGSIVWNHAAQLTTNKVKLDRLQRIALTMITGMMKTAPTEAVEVILGIPPLHFFTEEMALRTYGRLQNNMNNWDGLDKQGRPKSHILLLKKSFSKCIKHNAHVDTITRTKINNNININYLKTNIDINQLQIYTDGSKMGKDTGFGWCITKGNMCINEENYKLPDFTTVFQAEIIAIKKALEWCNDNLIEGEVVNIHSDSKSALQAISGICTKSRTVLECCNVIMEAKNKIALSFNWVKGHADNTGNEFVDALAKIGTTNNSLLQTYISESYIKKEIKNFVENKWQKQWQNSKGMRHTKKFINKVKYSNSNIKKQVELPKNKLKILIEWITGHAALNKHLMRLKLSNTAICNLCQENEETAEHILLECPYTEELRYRFYNIEETIFRNHQLYRIEGKWVWEATEITENLKQWLFMCYDLTKQRLKR